jgi:hypothetical protein
MVNNKYTVKWNVNFEWVTLLLCMQGSHVQNYAQRPAFMKQDFSSFPQFPREMPGQ